MKYFFTIVDSNNNQHTLSNPITWEELNDMEDPCLWHTLNGLMYISPKHVVSIRAIPAE